MTVQLQKSGNAPAGSLTFYCRSNGVDPCCAQGGNQFTYVGGTDMDQKRRAREDGFPIWSSDIRCNACRLRDQEKANRAFTARLSFLQQVIKTSEEQIRIYNTHTNTHFVASYALQVAKQELETLLKAQGIEPMAMMMAGDD